jgi:hypothetical protein
MGFIGHHRTSAEERYPERISEFFLEQGLQSSSDDAEGYQIGVTVRDFLGPEGLVVKLIITTSELVQNAKGLVYQLSLLVLGEEKDVREMTDRFVASDLYKEMEVQAV